MLRFVIRKLLNKKWMVAAILIGNVLLVSIASGNPMYTHAVLQKTLTKSLESFLTEKNQYPGLVTIKTSGSTRDRAQLFSYAQQAEGVSEAFGVDCIARVEHYILNSAKNELVVPRDDSRNKSIALGTMTGIGDHIEFVAGRMYADAPDESCAVEVILSERALMDLNVLLDEELIMPDLAGPDGEALHIRIVGVFKNSSSSDPYWVRTPAGYSGECFMADGIFRELFMSSEEMPYAASGVWYQLLDYTAMRADRANDMLAVADACKEALNPRSIQIYKDNFSSILTEYLKTEKKVTVTLWVLQTPIFTLLAAFIFMVSRQMLEMEQNEIAVIKSRGAGKGQIFLIYLSQSALISALGLGIGIPLGSYLCQVIGSSNAFLEFVKRTALDVQVTNQALYFALAAAGLSVLAMTLPAIKYSKTTIVSHKQKKGRRSSRPMWQKAYLDVIILGVSLYGLYAFNGQRDILAQRVLEGASLDPLLFLSSSLFMIGAGLLAVRIIPIVVWVVFTVFRRFWSPALYASFLRVLRSRESQGFIMVFLIMTIALGVFDSQAARTINQNAEDNISYSIGADVVAREVWADNSSQRESDPSIELVYTEPDFGKYETLAGKSAIAKVYVNENVSMAVSGGTVKSIRLMGVNTRDFGLTAWFKDSLSDIDWYYYLNAISQNSRAVLVSKNFATNYGLALGDAISYRNADGDSIRGIIYGFMDYFPSYAPSTYSRGADGMYKETEKFLIVAHLSQIQSAWGVEPYEIWFKNEGSSDYIYDFAEKNGVAFSKFTDTAAELVEQKNDPVLQGTNGTLTVGFIVVLLLCSVGFLIYWILSIQSRSLQFGIFRAMGMSMREVISMLLNEQLFISGTSIATGALVGNLTVKLYLPLIQLAYAASDNSLPLEEVVSAADSLKLYSTVGAVMLVCVVILGLLVKRMKVAQALKLGED